MVTALRYWLTRPVDTRRFIAPFLALAIAAWLADASLTAHGVLRWGPWMEATPFVRYWLYRLGPAGLLVPASLEFVPCIALLHSRHAKLVILGLGLAVGIIINHALGAWTWR